MELMSTFRVAGPVDRAWAVITDLERVAPCLPGAALLGVDGDDYRGAVKIKVGPVTAQYEGVARFATCDDGKHHAVVRAEGRDVRGQGNAAATIDMQLSPRGDGTEVVVVADLELAGRVAQFGRGVIADVSGKLIAQFAQRLEEEMGREPTGPAGTAPTSPDAVAPQALTRARSIEDVEPVDLMTTGGGAVVGLVKQQAVPLGSAALGLLLGWLVGRAGRRTTSTALPTVLTGAGATPIVLQLVLPDTFKTTAHDAKGDR